MKKHDEPLGLPKGSVRAVLVLSLVGSVALISLSITLRVILSTGEDFSPREAFLLVFGTLASLANLGVGYYFGTRNPGTS